MTQTELAQAFADRRKVKYTGINLIQFQGKELIINSFVDDIVCVVDPSCGIDVRVEAKELTLI